MGRRPIFDQPMTIAERSRRYRAKIMKLVRKRRGENTHSGYEQDPWGYYAETDEAVHAFLDHEDLEGEILDPCCGSGTIPRVCTERGLQARGYDLIDRGYGYSVGNFYDQTEPVDNIMCNPPFKRYMLNGERRGNMEDAEWVIHALKLARRKVVVFARHNWQTSKRRHAFFEAHPPARVYLFTSRVHVPPAGRGIKRRSGSIDYAWFVFPIGYQGPTTTIRLPPRGLG